MTVQETGHGSLDKRALFDAAPDILLAIDGPGAIVEVSHVGDSLLGWPVEEWIGRSGFDLIHPQDLPLVANSMLTVQAKEVGLPIEVRVLTGDGSYRLMEIRGRSLMDDHGVILLAVRDVTDRRRLEVARGDVVLFQSLVQHSPAVTLLLDGEGVVHSMTGALTRLLGHDSEAVLGQPLADFAAPEDDRRPAEALRRAASSRGITTVEARMTVAGGGRPRPFRFEVANLLDDPVVSGLIVSAHDVTELHDARAALERLATHDPLTGLPNRAMLLERLQEALDRAGRRDGRLAVLFIDLDRFKPVNDLLGHEAGDELLQQLAGRLVRLVRAGDLVARVGGDEFVVVAEDVDGEVGAEALAHRIEVVVAEPFTLSAGPAQVYASVGVAVADRGDSVAAVLAEADSSMYAIKSFRRGAGHRIGRRVAERRALAEALAVAVELGDVRAHYQPITRVADRSLVGFEALVRWHHPERGVLSPADFLDVAEEANLDARIGDIVLEQACYDLARWSQRLPGLTVAVNLSVAQLADAGLTTRLGRLLQRHQLDPSCLHLEVTERATLERGARGTGTTPEAALKELRALGVRLVLDDFGTGYSSLTHVRRFPLHALKIDRSFVAAASSNDDDRSVVAAVVGLAHALGLTCVGEGVEREDQLAVLRELGCDLAQGYLLGRPVPAPEAERHLPPLGAADHAR